MSVRTSPPTIYGAHDFSNPLVRESIVIPSEVEAATQPRSFRAEARLQSRELTEQLIS
jgi:hypothetical protein